MEKYIRRFLPVFLGIALIATYIFSNQTFVKCSFFPTGCREIESGNISQIENPGKNDLKDVQQSLTNKISKFDEKNWFVKIQNESIEITKRKINDNLKLQNLAELATPSPTPLPTPPPETKDNIAPKKTEDSSAKLKKNGDDLKIQLANQELDLKKYQADAENAEKEVQNLRRQVSDRYSSRMLFMFLTAAFTLLCIAAAVISALTIKIALDPSKDKNTPLSEMPRIMWICQITVPILAFIFIEIIDWCFAEQYLSIVIPIYRQSISGSGDVSLGLIHFFNLLGFGTIIYMLSAASILFYAVIEKRETAEANRQKLEALEEEKERHIKEASELEKTLEPAKTKIVELKTQIGELEKAIQTADENHELSEETLKTLKANKDRLTQETAELEKTSAPDKTKVDDLKAQISKLEKAIVMFKATSETNEATEKNLELLKVEKEIIAGKIAKLEKDAEPDETKINNLKDEISELEKKTLKNAVEIKKRFEPYKKSITAILYVGAGMLFVGMLRIKLLADWHLIFVSIDKNSANYLLLSDFFKNSIAVQAGFYSIFLLGIYLPVIYAIPSVEELPNEPTKNLFEKIGLPFSSEFMAKCAAVFSPVLAGPIVEFFNYLVGKTG